MTTTTSTSRRSSSAERGLATPGTGGTIPRPSVRVAVAADPQVRIASSHRLPGADPLLGTGSVSLRVGMAAGQADAARSTPEQVLAARGAIMSDVGLGVGDAIFAEQVHGAAVARVGGRDRGRGAFAHADAVAGVDALVTTDTGVALVVMAADCQPVVLVSPAAGVAAVHAGRSGVTAGVVPAAVTALARATSHPPATMTAFLGAAVGGCCYELPDTMVESMCTTTTPAARAETRWGTPGIDLPTAVTWQLRRAGVGRVVRIAGCTWCVDGAARFSHRASRRDGRPEGRQCMVIARAEGGEATC